MKMFNIKATYTFQFITKMTVYIKIQQIVIDPYTKYMIYRYLLVLKINIEKSNSEFLPYRRVSKKYKGYFL